MSFLKVSISLLGNGEGISFSFLTNHLDLIIVNRFLDAVFQPRNEALCHFLMSVPAVVS